MSPLISVAELATVDPLSVVVVDCRYDVTRPGWGWAQYEQGHIAGAHFADMDRDLASPPTATSGRHPLPLPATFAAWLGSLGVDGSVTVVAYDQGSGALAARLWWLVRAFGHPAVRVLDGGLAAWAAAGQPVTAIQPAPRPVQPAATASFRGWVATADVQRDLASDAITLVDARAADRYAGQNETVDPVAGHIAGALNRPFAANLGPDGRFLPPETLRAQWQALLGERSPGELVVSCGSGVTACHHLLALEAAALPGARLYVGSFSEWIRDPARPVVTGSSTR